MTKLGALLTACLILLSAPSLAQDRPVLVELFTSQGCSSCPPADAFLHELAQRDDVVALALHVDYWDYIGWKDTFAKAAHSKRQRAYAREAGRRMVYTPQMIINGADHVVGNRPTDVADLISKHKRGEHSVDLSVSRYGGRLHIDAQARQGSAGKATVQLVRYRPESSVEIKSGENAGRTLSYANVVTDWQIVADWDTRRPLALEVPLEGELPAAVLIQEGRHGPAMAVARVN